MFRPDNVQITKEEYKRIEKHMKDEKFHELLGDYMLEVSDPKNREEYDAYLKQLKAEGEMPDGLELLEPKPSFCIRSTLASKKDKKFSQGIYVNICMHERVGKPVISGRSWSVPYMVGKVRYDQEEDKVVCNTVDVVFHPSSVVSALTSPQLHKLLCDSALDGCQSILRERKEEINRDYKVMKGMTCKGGKPALLPVKMVDGTKEALKRNVQPGGKVYNEIMDRKEKFEEGKKEDGKEEALETGDEEEIKEIEEKKENFSNGPIAPKYSLVHSYPIEMGQFFNKSALEIQETQLPKKLVLKVELPSVDGLDQLVCDIKKDKFELSYKKLYYLSLGFNYFVDEERAKAKFINSKKLLKITLPIVSKKQEIVQKKIEPEVEEEEENIVEEEVKEEENKKITESEFENEIIDGKLVKKDENKIKTEKEEDPTDEIEEVIKEEENQKDEEEKEIKKNELLEIDEEKPKEENPIILPHVQTNQTLESKPTPKIEEIKSEKPQTEEKTPENAQEEEVVITPLTFIKPFTDSTVSENLRILTFHLPKYKNEGLYLIYEKNHGLVRYMDDTRNIYFAFESSENFNMFSSAKITLKKMTDYFSIMIEFIAETPNTEIWDKEVKLRTELSEDEILSLEALIISESKINEENEKEQEDEEDEKVVKVEEGMEEIEEKEKEVEAVEETPDVVEKEEDVNGEEEEKKENEKEEVEEKVAVVDLGVQLIEFDLYDYVTQLD